jgi:hypothetical protein
MIRRALARLWHRLTAHPIDGRRTTTTGDVLCRCGAAVEEI